MVQGDGTLGGRKPKELREKRRPLKKIQGEVQIQKGELQILRSGLGKTNPTPAPAAPRHQQEPAQPKACALERCTTEFRDKCHYTLYILYIILYIIYYISYITYHILYLYIIYFILYFLKYISLHHIIVYYNYITYMYSICLYSLSKF